MNKIMKKTLKVVIATIFLIILISGSISYGLLIKQNQVLNFCGSHYKNETFLLTMVGDEPAEPKVCGTCKDYFLSAEYIFFTFFLPIALVIIAIASLLPSHTLQKQQLGFLK